jgi:hypothetical protein
MAERVPCLVFPCRNCGVPILLPLDDFERLVPRQPDSPTDTRAAILVCEPCKHAYIYSHLPDSPYFQAKARRECFRTGVAESLGTLQCAGIRNEFRVPVIATWIEGTTVEKKQQRISSWRGDDLRCPEGHPIRWPFGK